MKLYIISGLGGDEKVFEKITFPAHLELVFIEWLIPNTQESLTDYVARMAANINTSEAFYLLGYSFGGILVQEINKIKPAKKVVILASIKSEKGKSRLMTWGRKSNMHQKIPEKIFNEKSIHYYVFLRKLIDPKNPKLLKYFTVRHPYYLKWSIEKILDWEFEENPNIIQILGNKDLVFPIKNSKPDYVIQNGTHLFPVTKAKELSALLNVIFFEKSA